MVAEGLGFYSRSGHTKDFKSSIRSFPRLAQPEVRRVKCMCVVRLVCYLTAFNPFMIDICNGPPIENGLHNVCSAPAVPYLYLYAEIFTLKLAA